MVSDSPVKKTIKKLNSMSVVNFYNWIGENAGSLIKEEENILEILHDIIRQDCYGEKDGEYDSKCMSAYNDAIRLLVKHGVLDIVAEEGRRIIAKEVK